MGDPLSDIQGRSSSSNLLNDAKKAHQNDFQAELKQAQDPDSLLVRWCLEGRPRVTAALAEEGSIVRLSAQLLSETTHKSFGASAEPSIELSMLKAAFLHKIGQSAESAVEFRRIAVSGDLSARWKRRAYVSLGWVLAAMGDFRACIASSVHDGLADPHVDEENKFALLLAGSRLYAEIGDVTGARELLKNACVKFPQFVENSQDCRVQLAEARVCFFEGRIDDAAGLWYSLTTMQTPTEFRVEGVNESSSSWLAAFAISAVVGDLGGPVLIGSRHAKHEAANNFAVCNLHIGRLDGAIAALEDVMRSFGAPGVVDGVTAGNLRTLYELCRTPEHSRLVS